MNSFKHLLFLVVTLATAGLSAQKDSDVLFTVADKPVTVGEFKYIYSKTNSEEVEYSDESVREYLDLYERFKLKVARAKAMGLDTVIALQNELEGYRRELAKNYLVDRQVTDRLVAQLHQRQQQDLEFAHILYKFKGNPSPADTAALFHQAKALKARLTASNFADEAKKNSQDNFSAPKGGKIGYITAPFPKGMHQLEAVLYQAKVNEVVGPVKTALGYHLAIKTAERQARGEVEIAHILIRKPAGTKAGAMPLPVQLQSAQKMLASGEDFAKVAAKISEDGNTKDKAGYLGFIGVNRYEPAFENAAFALTKDGQVSNIIESSVGFHLIRRISSKGIQPLDDVRPLLETKVKADGRFEDAKKQMLQNIRVKANVQENKAVFGRYAASLVDSTFLSFRWKPAKTGVTTPLLAIGTDYKVGLDQFQEYLRKNGRNRVSMGRNSNASTVASNLYDTWINKQLMAYADSRLEDDFPEFAALMREYREGILLFEATKIEVWDKASKDTTGLKKFFAAHRDDYKWEERATLTRYVVKAKSGVDINDVYAFAADHNMDATLDKFGRANIDASADDFELSRLKEIENLTAKIGSRTPVANDMRKGVATFSKVEALLPARNKELREARGYVIADYQDQLEREWVEKLRKQFPIKINKKALNKLIKS